MRAPIAKVVALIAVLATPVVVVAAPSPEIKEILGDHDFKFCSDPDYKLEEGDRAYCDLVAQDPGACPAFAEACKHAAPTQSKSEHHDDDTGDDHKPVDSSHDVPDPASTSGDRPKEDPPKPNGDSESGENSKSEPDRARDRSSGGGFAGIGWFGQVLFIGAIILFVGAIVRHLVKNFERGPADPDEPLADGPTPEAPEKKVSLDPVERDVERLLARARSKGDRDPKGAMEDVYAALLRRLESQGFVDLHPSRTNGDYVRALRQRPELESAVRGISRDLERVQFGSADPTPATFHAFYERALPWVARAIAAFALVIVAHLGVACDEGPIAGASAGAGGTTPRGTLAFAQLLERHGRTVDYRRADEPASDEAKVIVVLPGAALDREDYADLLERVRKEGAALVLADGMPKAVDVTIAHVGVDSGKLRTAAGSPPRTEYMQLALPPTAHFDPVKRTTASVIIERAGDDPYDTVEWSSSPTERYPYAVRLREGEGVIIAFADGQLFRNVALAFGDNAAFLAALFASLPKGDVELVDGFSDVGASSPAESIANAHLWPILLQLGAVFVLYLFYKGVHFGSPRDTIDTTRRAFAEHARAMGAAFGRAKASRHALGNFGVWALERLRLRAGRTEARGTRELAAMIAQRTGEPEATVLATLREVQSIREDAGAPSSRGPELGGDGTIPSPRSVAESHVAIMARLDSYLRALSLERKRQGTIS